MKQQLIPASNKSLGELKTWEKTVHGLRGTTTFGQFQITFYNDHIARITATQSDRFEDFSYAVVASPTYQPGIEEQDDALVLKTSQLVLVIQKHPVRFRFFTHDGQLINEDDAGLGTSWNGEQVTTYKKLQENEKFIGLGEKTGGLNRSGQGYQNWNTDSFGYGTSADPLYCTIPFYMGIHHGLSYGIFFDNSYKSFFNFGASNNRFCSFYADAGEMNYYFVYGKNVAEIIQQYTHLTGRIELPPLWSIGYQQCRYSYYPDKEVLTLAKTFRDKNIPADTIVLDIHYMDQYKIFTWNKRDFPDPKGLIQQLTEMGFRVVVICDPGIKVESGYQAYDEGMEADIFIKYPDGEPYAGQVWPGWCHFPDFTDPAARAWWTKQFKGYVDLGIEGYWNDMNEIATWGQMLPENMSMSFEGNGSTMRRGRNIYGLQMARSTYEGAKALLNGKRPFNLTRSGYAGIQRYGAVWTGDNVAYDEHMLLGVRLVNSMGLSGIPFAGYDIGGFVGDTTPQLFARWISIGTFSPFFRVHAMINSRDSEPWSYGEEVEQIARNYIKLRYKLLPYIYALFYEASVNGMPIQRSLAIDYTHDDRVYRDTYQNQYLFGPSLLIIPVESSKNFVKVFFPEGEWYLLYDGTKYDGNQEVILEAPLHQLPVFVKGGSIIPMQRALINTDDKADILQIHVYAGKADGQFTYYEDDGATFEYQQNSSYLKRELIFNAQHKTFTIVAQEGNHSSSYKQVDVIFHGFYASSITLNQAACDVVEEMNQYMPALEKFDPFFEPEAPPQERVQRVSIPYTPTEQVFSIH
jgi:alpha-glucosidase